MKMYKQIGIRIRGSREKAKMHQDELANAIGCTRTTISNIERGAKGMYIHRLVELAEIFGVSVLDLLPDSVKEV